MRVKIAGRFDKWVATVFHDRGFIIVEDEAKDIDILVFTGGEDISPQIYGHQRLAVTGCNLIRDHIEIEEYEAYPDAFKVGICRGGQLLNALSGGLMWQHVRGHNRGPHFVLDLETKTKHRVSSVHHQMMRPGAGAEVLALAVGPISDLFIAADATVQGYIDEETEAVWYPHTKSLCYQPHPEYRLESDTDYFFELLKRKIG